MNWSEFRPATYFLLKFLALYLVGNFIYGWYVASFNRKPDPITHSVTLQTSWVLNGVGWPTRIEDQENKPTVYVYYENKAVISVYEGCNGINMMIIYVAFLAAFGPYRKALLFAIPAGLALLHILNITRIGLLFFVSLYHPDYLYFIHKYFFTAFLYMVVFILWMIWIKWFAIGYKK